MKVSFELRAKVDTARLKGQARARVSSVVAKTAYDVVARMKSEMSSPKSGRWYGAHRASAPYEAPAVDTGALINSLFVSRLDWHTVMVGVGAEYGLYLELGTRSMSPRPFLSPAIAAIKQEFEEAIRNAVKP